MGDADAEYQTGSSQIRRAYRPQIVKVDSEHSGSHGKSVNIAPAPVGDRIRGYPLGFNRGPGR